MSYATKEDMVERFEFAELQQLTDDAGTGAIDDTRLQRALDDAGDVIDAHLAARYAVPLSPAPKILTRLQCDLARRQLYRADVPAAVQAAHDAAIRMLERLGDGRMSLGVDTGGSEVTPPADGGPSLDGPDRQFGRDGLEGF